MYKPSFIIFLFLYILSDQALSQSHSSNNIKPFRLEIMINKIADSLAYYYVDVEKGIEIGNHLKDRFRTGAYDTLTKPAELAKQLTKDLRTFSGDLHLYVSHPDEQREQNSSAADPEEYGSVTNYGFQEIKFLENHIAYIRISHFSNWTFANPTRQKITDVMNLFVDAEAFIFDLRNNPGGVPYVASFLASYFFAEEPVHLAQYYVRYDNFEYEIFTEPFAPGKKYPETPVFILVNKKSGSAAEEFPFWFQNHNRATIIGENTAGAGYGAMIHDVGNGFSASISNSVEVDPVTKKGFQGTGVIPDVVVADSNAFPVALKYANDAIRKENSPDSTKLSEFLDFLKTETGPVNQINIFNQVRTLHNEGLLSFNDINNLGYEYINEPQKAVPILKTNTVLYSFYPNSFDSYADALTSAELYEEALSNYNKAVQLAEIKNNPNLELFRSNRENFISEYGSQLEKN